jgi:exodeoxyribonuclease VII small subunit
MKKDIKFEEAMSSLEDIVKKLEANSLSLDESLSAFEEAVKLVKLCNSKLENAENKVRILTEEADGSVTDKPFEPLYGDAT